MTELMQPSWEVIPVCGLHMWGHEILSSRGVGASTEPFLMCITGETGLVLTEPKVFD